MPKLKRDYRCAPEGAVVDEFKAGDEVPGRVAEFARQDGALEGSRARKEKSHKPKRENKALKAEQEDKAD